MAYSSLTRPGSTWLQAQARKPFLMLFSQTFQQAMNKFLFLFIQSFLFSFHGAKDILRKIFSSAVAKSVFTFFSGLSNFYSFKCHKSTKYEKRQESAKVKRLKSLTRAKLIHT